jgi:hypothetical protein
LVNEKSDFEKVKNEFLNQYSEIKQGINVYHKNKDEFYKGL